MKSYNESDSENDSESDSNGNNGNNGNNQSDSENDSNGNNQSNDSNDSDDSNQSENSVYWCFDEASEQEGWVIKLDLTTPVKFQEKVKFLLLIINIKYFEIIHLITLLTINTNHYENKQTIVVSCNHTDDASYNTSIESRANQ